MGYPVLTTHIDCRAVRYRERRRSTDTHIGISSGVIHRQRPTAQVDLFCPGTVGDLNPLWQYATTREHNFADVDLTVLWHRAGAFGFLHCSSRLISSSLCLSRKYLQALSVASVAAPGVPCRTPIASGSKLALFGPADVIQLAAI